MAHSHDPLRQVRIIQQALTPDKMPVALLLGAGCPFSVLIEHEKGKRPLIPDVLGLTDEVSSRIGGEKKLTADYARLREQVPKGRNGQANVEDILSHLRTLRQAAGEAEARGLSAQMLKDLDDIICEIIVKCMEKRLPVANTPFHHLASWIGGITREHAVEVFTTNYDLCIEQALEDHRVPYFDGFVGSDRTYFDPGAMEIDRLPARWARVWKLHGSINWRQDSNGAVSRGENFKGYDRRLIHPSHLKYDESRRMPYLAMMDRLRAFLRQSPAVLVTCGYAFSDQHVNASLEESLQGNPSAICFGLLHGELNKCSQGVSIARRRANLNLLARDAGIIATREGAWILPTTAELGSAASCVQLTPKSGGGEDDEATCQLLLGDFVTLGAFLAGQIGREDGRKGEGDGR